MDCPVKKQSLSDDSDIEERVITVPDFEGEIQRVNEQSLNDNEIESNENKEEISFSFPS
jgi:hypothetical protein